MDRRKRGHHPARTVVGTNGGATDRARSNQPRSCVRRCGPWQRHALPANGGHRGAPRNAPTDPEPGQRAHAKAREAAGQGRTRGRKAPPAPWCLCFCLAGVLLLTVFLAGSKGLGVSTDLRARRGPGGRALRGPALRWLAAGSFGCARTAGLPSRVGIHGWPIRGRARPPDGSRSWPWQRTGWEVNTYATHNEPNQKDFFVD